MRFRDTRVVDDRVQLPDRLGRAPQISSGPRESRAEGKIERQGGNAGQKEREREREQKREREQEEEEEQTSAPLPSLIEDVETRSLVSVLQPGLSSSTL